MQGAPGFCCAHPDPRIDSRSQSDERLFINNIITASKLLGSMIRYQTTGQKVQSPRPPPLLGSRALGQRPSLTGGSPPGRTAGREEEDRDANRDEARRAGRGVPLPKPLDRRPCIHGPIRGLVNVKPLGEVEPHPGGGTRPKVVIQARLKVEPAAGPKVTWDVAYANRHGFSFPGEVGCWNVPRTIVALAWSREHHAAEPLQVGSDDAELQVQGKVIATRVKSSQVFYR